MFLPRFDVICALSERTRTDKWSLFVNGQLLGEVEQNKVICQWQADQLITEAEGETLANYGILRKPRSIIVLSFDHQACFFIIKHETIYHFSRNLKSMDAWTQLRMSGILFAAKSQLDGNAKVQTIICGQLFVSHKVGSVPMKRKEKVSSDNCS